MDRWPRQVCVYCYLITACLPHAPPRLVGRQKKKCGNVRSTDLSKLGFGTVSLAQAGRAPTLLEVVKGRGCVRYG
jgi:hypothetical protein